LTSTAVPADQPQGLTKLGGRPTLGRYMTQLWGRRHFVIELAYSRFRSQNEEDRLGIGWTVLGPLINAAVYGLIFGVIMSSGTRPENFVPFLVTGVFVFQYFSSCLSGGAKAIIGNMGLVRSLHFPRAVLPISLVLQNAFALMPMMAVLAVIVVLTGEPIKVEWLLVPPALLLYTMFNLGIAFIAARMTIHVRDLAQLIPFISRVLFYMSGVFFSVKLTVGSETGNAAILAKVMEYNPVHIYIQLVRHGFLTPDPKETSGAYATNGMWAMGAAWGVGLMVVGFLYFWLAEERYGRE
jgi:teichoic acid transport system permease protein